MIVVSDSSPLITLTKIQAKIQELDLLPQLYGAIAITPEVYAEVVVSGAGLAGSAQVAKAPWIEIRTVTGLASGQGQFDLGKGETSAIRLALELTADLVLMDDMRARRAARDAGLPVLGCVGILEDAYLQNVSQDLGEAYRRLLTSGAYVHRKILETSLQNLGLPPL